MRFATLQRQRSDMTTRHYALLRSLQTELDALPKSGRTAEQKIAAAVIQQRFLSEARAHATAISQLDEALADAAADDPLPVTDAFLVLDRIYAANYSSLGFGAQRATLAAAEAVAAKARHHGLIAVVEPVGGTLHTIMGSELRDYVVRANTTEIGKAMLSCRPTLPAIAAAAAEALDAYPDTAAPTTRHAAIPALQA